MTEVVDGTDSAERQELGQRQPCSDGELAGAPSPEQSEDMQRAERVERSGTSSEASLTVLLNPIKTHPRHCAEVEERERAHV